MQIVSTPLDHIIVLARRGPLETDANVQVCYLNLNIVTQHLISLVGLVGWLVFSSFLFSQCWSILGREIVFSFLVFIFDFMN